MLERMGMPARRKALENSLAGLNVEEREKGEVF